MDLKGEAMKRVLFGLVVAFSFGCQGGSGSQCSKWEIVILNAPELEKGTSAVPTPAPNSATARVNAAAASLKETTAGIGGPYLSETRAVPDGWEPIGLSLSMVVARRCVK